jgi:hypothetical protein
VKAHELELSLQLKQPTSQNPLFSGDPDLLALIRKNIALKARQILTGSGLSPRFLDPAGRAEIDHLLWQYSSPFSYSTQTFIRRRGRSSS